MAVIVLLVAGTDGKSSTAVSFISTGVVLNVAGTAKSSVDVQERVATLNEEATTTLGDGGGRSTTD